VLKKKIWLIETGTKDPNTYHGHNTHKISKEVSVTWEGGMLGYIGGWVVSFAVNSHCKHFFS
jgi:hypothetical protein